MSKVIVIFSNVIQKNFPIWSLVSRNSMSLGFLLSDVFTNNRHRSANFAAMLKIIVLIASANFGKSFSAEN